MTTAIDCSLLLLHITGPITPRDNIRIRILIHRRLKNITRSMLDTTIRSINDHRNTTHHHHHLLLTQLYHTIRHDYPPSQTQV